jgi:hypothetical protein
VPRHDDVRADQPAAGREQATQQRDGHGERRVRDHSEPIARKPQIACVGSHHGHAFVREARPQRGCATGVQLDRDDTRTARHERLGDRTEPRTDVEDQVTWGDARVFDEKRSPVRPKLVEPPPGPCPGHGAPS